MNYATQSIAEETVGYYTQQKQNAKKPGFFKRWILKTAAKEQENMNNIKMSTASIGIGRGEPNIDQPERALQFTVYNANGGRVIETRRYDRHKDRHTSGLYVITNDMDFGKEIDKIITMEALKQ